MKILAIDTSNQPLSVALVEDDKTIIEQTVNIRRNHSVQLMPAIEALFIQSNWELPELDRIVVAEGPGSYTGLRIAVTIAKTLAWAHDVELVGISSLKVIAANSGFQKDTLVVPLFDARRENIYTGLYTKSDQDVIIQLAEDVHIAAKDWAVYLKKHFPNKKFELIGVDAPSFLDVFKEQLGKNVYIAHATRHLPRGSVLAYLAKNEATVPQHQFVPVYLKLAEAEENWLADNPGFEGGNWVEKI